MDTFQNEYERILEEQVEKFEEEKNQFYDGLTEEVLQENFDVPPKKVEADDDEEEEDEEQTSGLYETKFSPSKEEDISEMTPDSFHSSKPNLRPLSPVRKEQEKEISLPDLPGIDKDYKTLLFRETGESAEMFALRSRIANLLSDVSIPRGASSVSLDSKTILLFSRMLTNKLWFGMKYNKDQELFLSEVIRFSEPLRSIL